MPESCCSTAEWSNRASVRSRARGKKLRRSSAFKWSRRESNHYRWRQRAAPYGAEHVGGGNRSERSQLKGLSPHRSNTGARHGATVGSSSGIWNANEL
eukprot:848387-Prorocentrum_minimum.AAC.3